MQMTLGEIFNFNLSFHISTFNYNLKMSTSLFNELFMNVKVYFDFLKEVLIKTIEI